MHKRKAARQPARREIRSAGWKRASSIALDKYESISRAILGELGAKPMRWGQLVDRIRARLPGFEGSVWWYTTACLRELETQGKVVRHRGPPVTYSKA